MAIILNGTTGITTPDIDSTDGFDSEDLTGDVAAARITDALSTSSLAAGNLTGDVAAARITGALNATGSAPIYACRAWVNFDGTGTVAIRASGNVSSITDNGTGNYTVNFTTAMPDANYIMVTSSAKNFGDSSPRSVLYAGSTKTTSAISMLVEKDSGANYDSNDVYLAFFR